MTDFKELEKAMEAANLQERVLVILMTLTNEYEAKAITQERFAKRCSETIQEYMKKLASPPSDTPRHSQEGK